MLMLAGCASLAPPISTVDVDRARARLPAGIALEATPFFPQTAYQCGPASLAMVLRAAGFSAEPKPLERMMYLPAREGALPTELLSAARRQGALATVLPPHFEALLNELAAGRPVLVLQNLLLERWPRWHYAVVVGYEPARDRLILRSGGNARLRVSRARFLATWLRAGRWAMVVAGPNESPTGFRPEQWLEAAVALESAGHPETALAAFTSAASAWPDDPIADFGRGNALWALGRPTAAMRAWRSALNDEPAFAPAINKLVHAHLSRNDWCAAVRLVPPEQADEPAPIRAARRAIALHAQPDQPRCSPTDPT